MGFGMVIIGDEILSGRRTDKHLPKVIELLSARGLSLDWAEYIGDDRERITATLKRSFASGDMVLSTGGIGAIDSASGSAIGRSWSLLCATSAGCCSMLGSA